MSGMRRTGRSVDTETLLQHRGWLEALARSLVHDDADVDDAIQETLLTALRKPPRKQESLGPWLRKVLRNLTFRRREQHRLRKCHELAAAERSPTPPTPEELLERAELHCQVVDAVLQLVEPLRSTVLLRYFEGMPSREIASHHKVDSSTVRWRLRKALGELRARLDQRHKSNRQKWTALLLPLSTADPLRGALVGSLAPGATGKVNLGTSWLLGGIAVTKTTVIALTTVGLLVFILGIGTGRMTTPSGAEQIAARHGLVPREKLVDIQAKHREAMAEIKGVRENAASEKARLLARITNLEKELNRHTQSSKAELANAGSRPDLSSALDILTEFELQGSDLWTLLHGKGNLESMKKVVEAVEDYYSSKLSSPDLGPEERESYERILEVNGYRKGYTYSALGESSKAREAFRESIESMNLKEASGRSLSAASKVYRHRSEYDLEFLENYAGQPAPAEFDLEEGWVTSEAVQLADSHTKTLGVVFRMVNDARSRDFLRTVSRFCSKRSDMEMVTIAWGPGDKALGELTDDLRKELLDFSYLGAAGVDPDTVNRSLFRQYNATVGSATFFIINHRGEPIWRMQDPHSRNTKLAITLLDRAAGR